MSPSVNRVPVRPSAWYAAPIEQFRSEGARSIIGDLTSSSPFDVDVAQADAWHRQLPLLRTALDSLGGWLYLEFEVPRLGSRIDAVAIVGRAVILIEFKVGEREYRRADYEQAWDYALDLKNFHEASHAADIFPILMATEAAFADSEWNAPHADGVRPPRRCNTNTLAVAVLEAIRQAAGPTLDGAEWGRAPYRPTPTIIQAARALYANHAVEAISRNDAGAVNIGVTSRRVEEIIDRARLAGQKAIVFITGVPGAGKTLVGLNVATQRRDAGETHAVYLSGNGPLVAVLREALTRDDLERRKARGERVRKGVVAQPVKAFIQNVHHFRDDGLRDESRPPIDRVVIFDESQRAWTKEKTSDFMRRRKKRPDFNQSEPAFLLSYMDRHPDWSVVVCLVGGGQEIHTGEAGVGEWLTAVGDEFPGWELYISPNLHDSEYAIGEQLAALVDSGRVRLEPHLHLAVSMRSFRAEHVSAFVKAALDGEVRTARELLRALGARYPIVLTRDLHVARRWLRRQARGSERAGIVASSQAQRLKPHAIDVRVSIDPVHYFLDEPSDTRSSSFLEDAATEFQVQGLELDWTCVSWDADLRRGNGGWSHHAFRGDQWTRVHKEDRRRYQINAYRVLLTRARQGMVIFVPPGDGDDVTRAPSFYQGTFDYLQDLGLPVIAT
ncbi:MAG TPA: DUF2075 domain-containing protein [Gemmatimonadaceae bacterium]|jgi:hypothetical protein|nr:DUF2075 domain-containing protein [Gemmatimonadaceae bacterium]